MDSIDWEIAGFTGEGTLDAFGTLHPIWVPPEVALEDRHPWASLRYGENLTPTLVYPVPENWPLVVIDVRWPPVVINADILELKDIGWTARGETAGLLEDFLRLARNDETQHTLDEKTMEAVRTFAKTWGPLWRCTNDRHWDCHWTSYSTAVQKYYNGIIGELSNRELSQFEPSPFCSWVPQEEVLEFVRKANEAKAVLDLAAHIRADVKKPIPDNPLRILRERPPEQQNAQLSWARRMISSRVNSYLWPLGGVYLQVTWNEGQHSSLRLSSGIGFIHAVWMKIAQLLSDAKGVYWCDGCGRPYIRTERKPQTGRRNYCPDCGMGGRFRAAKRLWAGQSRRRVTE
jgi:hypothetical protein